MCTVSSLDLSHVIAWEVRAPLGISFRLGSPRPVKAHRTFYIITMNIIRYNTIRSIVKFCSCFTNLDKELEREEVQPALLLLLSSVAVEE